MADKIQAAHILVKTRTEAEEILKKIKAGESFAILAQKYSQCPSKNRGGDLGWFGRGQMVKEFENAAFNLKNKGDLSEIVKTQFGFHIIRLLSK